MSRESLGATEPDDAAGAGPDDVPTTVLATISLDPPDGRHTTPSGSPDQPPGGPVSSPDQPPGGPVSSPETRTALPGRALLAGSVVAALVVGVLAGVTSARNQAQSRLEAGARVVVAIDGDGVGGGLGAGLVGGEAAAPRSVGMWAAVSVVGEVGGAEGVRVDRVRTAIGVLTVLPPVTVRADRRPERVLLEVADVDCPQITALGGEQGPTAAMLGGMTADVRPVGSRSDLEVPVLAPDPDTVLLPLIAHCSPGEVGRAVSYTVGDMVARADGSVSAVIGPGTAFTDGEQGQFTLARNVGDDPSAPNPYGAMRPARASADTSTFELPQTGWTVTTTPRLPLITTAPTRVTFRFGYSCRPAPRRTGPPELPDFPDVTVGTVNRSGSVSTYPDGWDDLAFRATAIAAAVRACGASRAS